MAADQEIAGEECLSPRKRFLVAHTIFILLLFLVLLLSPCVIASRIDLQQEEEWWLEEQADYD